MFLDAPRREDAGQALVMVIGMMLIMALVITVIVSSTVFGLGSTSQTRASVQANASAEAGIDVIAVAIMNDECGSIADGAGIVDQSGATPSFEGLVYYQETSTGGFLPGCPEASDYAYKVVSTGYAQQPGSMGYDRGDSETLEAMWIRTESPPRFEDAVRGDVYVGTAGVAGILSDENDANVYTVGEFYCPAGATIEGSVVVGGNARWTQNTCQVTGDLYVGGDLQYNIDPAGRTNVGQDLYVVGNLTHNLGKTYGNFDAGSNQNRVGVAGTIRVGGLIDAYCRYTGHGANTNWAGYSRTPGNNGIPASCGTGTDTRVQMRVPGLSVGTEKDFEVLTTASEPFGSWTPMEWDNMTGVDPGTVSQGRRVNGSTCDYHPWNGNGTIDVTTDTILDTTGDCDTFKLGNWGNVVINMSADLAIYADFFQANGNITINSVDGEEHSLYLIDPPPAGFTECPSTVPNPSAGAGGFHFSSGIWDQDEEIAVLAYTPGTFYSGRSDFVLGGQVYSCRSDFQSGFYLDFRRVGDQETSSSLASFGIEYLRRSP